ncbi:ANTAR domain-containing protein [Streptomyces sp. NPDC000348]|uniref:ANTAR domain-containing protein n=1 Tax=Streptomyces sp. NPDC000348 TaxID=3364538 RepID=UPI0036AFD298
MPTPTSPSVDFEAAFFNSPAPMVILGTDLRIQNVNHAYAHVTRRERDELTGMHMFEAFPDNPHDPRADGVAKLGASLRRVTHDRTPDTMHVQKYDIPWKNSPTGFTEKFWSPVNSPILDPGGALVGVVHHVEDVTDVHRELRRIRRVYERMETPTAHDAEAQSRFVRYLAHADEERDRLERLENEVGQLRQALASRAVIDQAIGIVQAERRCAPDDAFQILVGISQRTNVKLREIAAALVRQAAAADSAPLLPSTW